MIRMQNFSNLKVWRRSLPEHRTTCNPTPTEQRTICRIISLGVPTRIRAGCQYVYSCSSPIKRIKGIYTRLPSPSTSEAYLFIQWKCPILLHANTIVSSFVRSWKSFWSAFKRLTEDSNMWAAPTQNLYIVYRLEAYIRNIHIHLCRFKYFYVKPILEITVCTCVT